jgi:hypothetical protein
MKFFEFMMRNAAPVLFWTSVFLFVGGLVSTLLLLGGVEPSSGGSIVDPGIAVSAIYQAISFASLPFIGAAIVWSLQPGRKDGGA